MALRTGPTTPLRLRCASVHYPVPTHGMALLELTPYSMQPHSCRRTTCAGCWRSTSTAPPPPAHLAPPGGRLMEQAGTLADLCRPDLYSRCLLYCLGCTH